MSDQKSANLPETPFNGVVTSVIKAESSGYTYLHLAIAEEDERDPPLVVFCTFNLGSSIDPPASSIDPRASSIDPTNTRPQRRCGGSGRRNRRRSLST